MSFLQHVATLRGSLQWPPAGKDGVDARRSKALKGSGIRLSELLQGISAAVAKLRGAVARGKGGGVRMREMAQAPQAKLACISLQSRLQTSSSRPKFCGWDSMGQRQTSREQHSLSSATKAAAGATAAGLDCLVLGPARDDGSGYRRSEVLSPHVSSSAAWGPRSTLTESLRQRLEEFGPHELSMMLWAFAAGPAGKASQSGCGTFLEGERRKELAEMLAPEALRKLGEASFMSISNSLWACTTLRVLPALPGLCMAAATRTATADISELSPQSLSNVAWALALSVLSDSDAQRTAFDRAMSVAAETALRRTAEFRPAELVALSWALATSQASDSWLSRDATEQRRDVALSAVEATLANTPNSRQGVPLLAQAAWACANFPTAALSKPLWSRLAEALQVGLQGGCRSTSSQDLANGIWALAVASVAHADSSSFSALAGEAAKRDFEPRQLAACAWALASSRHRDPAWLKALERSSLRVIEELQLSEVAAISWAWAASEAGESLIEALLPRAEQLLEGPSPRWTRTSRGGPGFVEALLQLAWAGSFGQVSRASGLNKLIQDRLRREGRLRDSQTRGRMAEPASAMLVDQVPTHSSNSPTIVVNEEQQGFVVLHKPVHWEVDGADGVGSASRPIPLSGYMQIQFPNRPLLSDASAGGGFLGRLDAQSSGLVISALTYEAHLLLQFRQDTHSVAREYVALCHGLVPEDLHEIRLPILVRAGASSEVHASGVAAVTRLRVLARCSSSTEDYSLVVLSILTGRKHQIRCHLSHVGHPVVCDGRYAPQALQSDLQWCPRLFLHRFRLEFPGLDDGTIEASHGLPNDLQDVLRRLCPQSRTRMSEDVLSLWSRGDSLPFHEWAARSNARAQNAKGLLSVVSSHALFSSI
ncbi:ylyB [Symbiodinium sp. CCMP2592]|nr:ylyB [Symbiodinium sp. CCMP2592]